MRLVRPVRGERVLAARLVTELAKRSRSGGWRGPERVLLERSREER